MIVGVQTDVPLLNNTILVQKQEHAQETEQDEEDFNKLSLVCSAVGQSKTTFPDYSDEEITRLREKFAKLQSKAL